MKHIAYYNYDEAPEKVISESTAMLLKLSGYMPHTDRNCETNHLYYPIPSNEKPLWDNLKEEAA